MNPGIALAGRILIALLFFVSGVLKILHFTGTVDYFTKVGMPASQIMTVIAIIIELGGGILLIVGWRTRWVAWLLALFVLVATVVGHRVWEDAAQLDHFLKNVAIIGALLYIAAFGPGRYSIDKA